jgi:hypothetical protein
MKSKAKAKKRAMGSVKRGFKKAAEKGVKKVAKKAVKAKPPTRPAAVAKTDALDALILAYTQALRLPLDPAWHGGIKFNLQLILNLGALVDGFPLPDDAEPAPVFHA